MNKINIKLNISKILGLSLIFGLVFGALVILPAFSNTVEAKTIFERLLPPLPELPSLPELPNLPSINSDLNYDYDYDSSYYGNTGCGGTCSTCNTCIKPKPTCNTCTPKPVPTLSGSCSVNPSSVNVGDYVNWNASASGGSGNYTYSWSGTDGFNSNFSSISRTYSTAGTKTGTVTITSGAQSITRTCSVVVNQVVENNLYVSCSANPSFVDTDEDVVWRANVSGGDGSYTYSWSGTNGLSGNSRNVTWNYDNSGTKRGTVTVTSNGQSASASCTAFVDDNSNDYGDLSVSCYASPSNPALNSRMNWYANVSGGDGDYTYRWIGTDGLDSSSRSPSMTYNTPGSKGATLTVRDGDGNRKSVDCYANVNSVLAFSQAYQAPTMPAAVYLSQVPSTGFADNIKLFSFVGVLALFSAWIAYIIIVRKKEAGELN